MDERINALFERINRFLAKWPGALPLVGVGFILLNLLLQIFPWAAEKSSLSTTKI